MGFLFKFQVSIVNDCLGYLITSFLFIILETFRVGLL